ncbi:Bax inhibitor-1/YccA family protein [Nocardioides sp. InS609-2]|uniref:Bax inhibitor-1/YccA family protein n=1 Tax=Nocardioides sp. InS609-2 TaxID=2760705 RepID=UPI0017F449C1|nr:Bax inhibitor-1/YccA family protein [Nocardioides sp. InS609-2]MBA3782828.1 Bax inhibitor-1/YccA family protein [Nocardioides sp.]
MKSNNPVFARTEEFNRASTNAYGNQTYPGGSSVQGSSDPSTWGTGTPTDERSGGRMTIDSVVQATGISLAVVMVTAAITWWFIGDVAAGNGFVNEDNYQRAIALMTIGSLGAFGLSMVNSFKRVVSPPLVLLFAAVEGVALGALSKFFESYAGAGVVTGAVVGTFAAFAGTLAAYKIFNIQVGQKFRIFVVAAMFGMVGLGLLSFVLSMFGVTTGLFGFGTLGLVMAVVGLVLGIFMLILDFDYVENGIAAGLPERESWRAAFGLTVSLVWIYTNLLRILAIFSQD